MSSAAKLHSPPRALIIYAPPVMNTRSGSPPLSPLNAGVYPSKLMMADASSGAANAAISDMVAPSNMNTARICPELAPRLRNSASSPRCCSTSKEDSVIT